MLIDIRAVTRATERPPSVPVHVPKTAIALAGLAAALCASYAALIALMAVTPDHQQLTAAGEAMRPVILLELAILAVLSQMYPVKFAPNRATTASLGACFALVLYGDYRVSVPAVV